MRESFAAPALPRRRAWLILFFGGALLLGVIFGVWWLIGAVWFDGANPRMAEYFYAARGFTAGAALLAWATYFVLRTRRHYEHALRRASAQQFRGVVENASEGIIIADTSGIITYFNRAAERIFGWTREEIVGKSADLLVPEDLRDAHRTGVRRAVEAGGVASPVTREVLGRRKDGTTVPIDLTPGAYRSDDGVVLTCFVRDVTERRRALDSLRTLKQAIEQVGDLVLIADTSGVIEYVNATFERETGYTSAEAVGKTPNILKSGSHPPEFYRSLWTTIAAGNVFRATFKNRRKNGDIYEEERTISPIRDERGRVVRFVSTGRNVTERNRLEEKVRQAQKMEAIGKLAGGVAHDFNNILTVITNCAQFILDALPPESPTRADAEEVRKAADRAAALTRQLLAFSRKQVLQPKPIGLNDVAANLGRMLSRLIGEHIELATRLDPGLWTVVADPTQVEQVVMNLALNARDAMPNGGRLTIETANVVVGEGAVPASETPPGPYAMLAVSDTGCGMDAEVLRHLFEPFFTTKEMGRGTGLGLATVYGIVKQSGAHIGVYSEVGRGTSFKIYFPRVECAVSPSPEIPAPCPCGTEKVLLVEDDEQVRATVAAALRRCGYAVVIAAGGLEALAACRETPCPDIVVTDAVMPGMSGFELADRIQEHCPEVRLLLMSGYTEHAILDAPGRPTRAFIQKPFSAEALARKIREVLDAPPPPGKPGR